MPNGSALCERALVCRHREIDHLCSDGVIAFFFVLGCFTNMLQGALLNNYGTHHSLGHSKHSGLLGHLGHLGRVSYSSRSFCDTQDPLGKFVALGSFRALWGQWPQVVQTTQMPPSVPSDPNDRPGLGCYGLGFSIQGFGGI